MRKELAELQEIEKNLNAQLIEIRGKIRDLRIAIYKQETGFDIGVKINYRGKDGEISSFRVDYDITPYVRLYKKDGTLGRETGLWSFDMKHLKII